MEFKKDPVQFVIDNNDEVKELVDQLDLPFYQNCLVCWRIVALFLSHLV
jgi:hypothetical protein